MRGRFLSVAIFCFVSLAASAQIPTKGNIFFGYSYMSADNNVSRANLNGWNASLEGKFLPWVGIVADLSGQYGSPSVSIACPQTFELITIARILRAFNQIFIRQIPKIFGSSSL